MSNSKIGYISINEIGRTKTLFESEFIAIGNAQSANLKLLETLSTKIENNNCYYTITAKTRNRFFTELISGQTDAELHASLIIAPAKIVLQIISENNINSIAHVAYLLEKKGLNIQFIAGANEVKQQNTISDLFKLRFNWFKNFYFSTKKIPTLIFMLLSIILFFTITTWSKKGGISGDELLQHYYSQVTANKIGSKFGIQVKADTNGMKGQKLSTITRIYNEDKLAAATAEDPDRLMHLYGNGFDNLASLTGAIFGVKDFINYRHWLNAIFGFFIAFFAALIVKKITRGNYIWATAALVSVFFIPRVLGDSFSNPKDIPFALGYIMSCYYAIKIFSNLLVIRTTNVIGLIVSIALAMSIRVGALIIYPIIGLFLLIAYMQWIGLKNFIAFKWKKFLVLFGIFILICLGSYILGVAFWPWGADEMFSNPIKALSEFSNYSGSLRQLFEGQLTDSDMLPRHYTIKYLAITTPIILLVGALLSIIFGLRKNINVLAVLIFAALPILYIVVSKPNVYGGLRHILFTVPCIGVLGVLGFYFIENWLSQKMQKIKLFPIILLGIGMIPPAVYSIKNNPYQYTYFNEFTGGTKGALGKYEIDYYLYSLRESTEWFLKNIAKKNPDKKYIVRSYGMWECQYWGKKIDNVKFGFIRYDEKFGMDWDYAIFYNGYMDKYRLENKIYPPANAVFVPKAGGVPLGCVIEHKNKKDIDAMKLFNEKKFYESIAATNEFLSSNPNDPEAYFHLSNCYYNLGNSDSAIIFAKKSIEKFPEYSKPFMLLFQALGDAKKYDELIKYCNTYMGYRPKDADALRVMATAYAGKEDYKKAIEFANKSIAALPYNGATFQVAAFCYNKLGMTDKANKNATASKITSRNAQEQTAAVSAALEIYNELTGKEIYEDDFRNNKLN